MATLAPNVVETAAELPQYLHAMRVVHTSRHALTIEAIDERTGSRRAVKRLRPERMAEAGPHRRLLGEADALARLGHRNIVHLHGVATCSDSSPALVLEFVDGPTLRDVMLEGRTLPGETIRLLGMHLGLALAHVHDAGLVHADVKPANVMLDGERTVLIDFHLARRPGALTSHIGTRGFTAPEVVDIDHMGKAADAWGLGVVLYRARNGALPDPTRSWWSGESKSWPLIDRVIHQLLAPQPERRLGCARAAQLLEMGE